MTKQTFVTCKVCGKKIRLVETQLGKWIPCDIAHIGYVPLPYSREHPEAHFVLSLDGKWIRCYCFNTPSEGLYAGYLPHFRTCGSKVADKVRAT